MVNEFSWITALITEAVKLHPTVTEAASARIEVLLNGQFSERQVPRTQLTKAATELIADMVPAPPKIEAKQ